MELLEKLTSDFERRYAEKPALIVKAPGRVNLIGEHTDYNDGFVLPCAIDYSTLVALSPRDDNLVHVVALDYQGEEDSFSLSAPMVSHDTQQWANYIRGVVSELQKRELPLKGANIMVTGNVPQGAGLSSSASLEVGITYAFDQYCQLGLSKQDVALISQAAENNFVGCACGIMDQLISASGQENRAMGIDCRSLALTPVSIPHHLALIKVNSNVKRGLVDSEYNVRRQQCEQAASYFGVSHLRDVSVAQFESSKQGLDPLVAQRAEHVIYENQRTLDAMKALDEGDVETISQLMAQSHASMRDLFEITTPEIDYLVETVDSVIGNRGGVRMTGGGFGGCIIALVPHDMVDAVLKEIELTYQQKTGLKESVYISQPVDGVSLV